MSRRNREFWIEPGYKSWLEPLSGQAPITEKTHVIEKSAYDSAIAERDRLAKELLSLQSRFNQSPIGTNKRIRANLRTEVERARTAEFKLKKMREALEHLNQGAKEHLKVYGIERNENGRFVCMIADVCDKALSESGGERE